MGMGKVTEGDGGVGLNWKKKKGEKGGHTVVTTLIDGETNL
jgi:hypothetical protein